MAQYPLSMGRKQTGSSNALAIKVDGEGKVDYTAIARRGHGEKRIVQASFKDLIPLRQQANAGELDLSRPSEEDVEETRKKTADALAALVSGAVAAQKPKNVKGTTRKEATFVRYTPAAQMGEGKGKDRIIKIQERQIDPMEPPKFKHKKIPRGGVAHPAPVSNWKNPKGYTVPLDKRLAADGRGLQDVTINDKFAQFAEALFTADRHAREEVKQRALMQQRLAEKEKEHKEDNLRALAQRAREERANAAAGRRASRDDRSPSSRSRSRSGSYSSRSPSPNSEEEDMRERERIRAERRRENQREMRQKNMGHERKLQMMAREQNRDISEKVALGLAKPTQSKETMYDSRLFNQSSGFAAGFNEDQAYDKPLFADRDALNSIYRPSMNDDEDDGGETLERIQGTKRFEALGRAPKEGFKGAGTAEAREGPVQFERDRGDDPFGVDQMIADAQKAAGQSGGTKRYGLQEAEGRESKRARVEEDD
ncbi:mRNA splicing protein [Taxawa tesnikishii (nom. ined.)]|nr:mRNA splicing protein [Dothideales sp. JES 119]